VTAGAPPRTADYQRAAPPHAPRRLIPPLEVRRACARVAAKVLHSRGLRALLEIHAAMEETLDQLDSGPAMGAGIELRVEGLVLQAMGPDLAGSAVADRRRRNPVPPAVLSPAHALRELLYACVHPGLPPDRQASMLLRFGFWLPNDASATLLQTGSSTVDIHLRQCCRRLGAVARRGGTARMPGQDARCLTLLRHLDLLRQRGAELQGTSPEIAEAVDTDTRFYAALLVDTESGSAQGAAHAFLAQLLLGAERAQREQSTRAPNAVPCAGAKPGDDATAAGIRHLRAAQELGAQDRFLWLAKIHAAYLLAPDQERIDWQQLVGLYEGLLRATELTVSMRHVDAPNTPSTHPVHRIH
jgi:hypothetical protein